MTPVLLFLEDPYQFTCSAEVTTVQGNLVVLNQTVFYPQIGEALSDVGHLVRSNGEMLPIIGSAWVGAESSQLGHLLAPGFSPLRVGDKVVVRIDRQRRLLQMRLHTALHLVSIAFPFSIVAKKIQPGEGYIDFDVDRTGMSTRALQDLLRRLIAQEQLVVPIWLPKPISSLDEPSVAFTWPGRHDLVRAIKIGRMAIEPFDGLHVSNTGEIGRIRVRAIYPIGRSRCRIVVSVTAPPPAAVPYRRGGERDHQSRLVRPTVR